MMRKLGLKRQHRRTKTRRSKLAKRLLPRPRKKQTKRLPGLQKQMLTVPVVLPVKRKQS